MKQLAHTAALALALGSMALAITAAGCSKKKSDSERAGAEGTDNLTAQTGAPPGFDPSEFRQIKTLPSLMDPGKRAAQLQERLKLSDEQRDLIAAALRDNADPKARKAAVKAVLSADQLKSYEQMFARRSLKPGPGGTSPRGRGGPAAFAGRLQKHLSLSDEQRGKLADILASGGPSAERTAAIKALFTAEQFARYESMYVRKQAISEPAEDSPQN